MSRYNQTQVDPKAAWVYYRSQTANTALETSQSSRSETVPGELL